MYNSDLHNLQIFLLLRRPTIVSRKYTQPTVPSFRKISKYFIAGKHNTASQHTVVSRNYQLWQPSDPQILVTIMFYSYLHSREAPLKMEGMAAHAAITVFPTYLGSIVAASCP